MSSTKEKSLDFRKPLRIKSFFTVLFIIFLTCVKANAQHTQALLCGRWTYISIFNASGDKIRRLSDTDVLSIGCDSLKSFAYDLHFENIHASGTWELVQNTLHFSYHNKDVNKDSRATIVRKFRILLIDEERLLFLEVSNSMEEGLYFMYHKKD